MSGTGYVPAALPQLSGRSMLVARVLGLYIAGAAGTIQLMDIVVDRAGLPDRVFAFVIVLAVIGLPVAAAAALMFDIAAAERRPPPSARPTTTATRTMTARPTAPAESADLRAAAARDENAAAEALPQRLEIALSYRRIALLHEAAGSDDEARPHRQRFEADITRIAEDLKALIERRDG